MLVDPGTVVAASPAAPTVRPTGRGIEPGTGRDTYIDLLRVTGVTGVVFGHWMSSTVYWHEGRVGVDSVLAEARWAGPASWIFAAVPLILFAGGYANHTVFTRLPPHRRARTFVARRIRRLLAPTAAFVGLWFTVECVLHLTDAGGSGAVRGVSHRGVLPFGPLWFVGVYLAIVVLCPAAIALQRRWSLGVPVGLGLAALLVDLARFAGGLPVVGWLNLLLAWMLPHQLGIAYADGSLRHRPASTYLGLAAAGLAALVALTGVGPYPVSIGGLPGDRLSNMRPPTVCIVALTLWQVGLALWCRPLARRRLDRARVRPLVDRLNGLSMTIFLWHMTALLVVVLLLVPFGLSQERLSVAYWALQRPLWLVLCSLVLYAIARTIGPIERWR